MNCTYCGASTHTLKHCPKTASGQGNRARLRCGYCGGNDHDIDACPRNANASRRRSSAWADHFIFDRNRT